MHKQTWYNARIINIICKALQLSSTSHWLRSTRQEQASNNVPDTGHVIGLAYNVESGTLQDMSILVISIFRMGGEGRWRTGRSRVATNWRGDPLSSRQINKKHIKLNHLPDSMQNFTLSEDSSHGQKIGVMIPRLGFSWVGAGQPWRTPLFAHEARHKNTERPVQVVPSYLIKSDSKARGIHEPWRVTVKRWWSLEAVQVGHEPWSDMRWSTFYFHAFMLTQSRWASWAEVTLLAIFEWRFLLSLYHFIISIDN